MFYGKFKVLDSLTIVSFSIELSSRTLLVIYKIVEDRKTLEMILLTVSILLCGVLLQPQQATAKEYHLDFTRYCQLTKDLLTYKYEKEFYYVPLLDETVKLYGKLVAQGFSYSQATSRCKDPSTYFKTECLFLTRQKLVEQSNFFYFFQNDRLKEFRPLYFDVWLLHPALRGCQQIIGRRPKASEVKKRILSLAFNGGIKMWKAGKLFRSHFRGSKPLLVKEVDELCGRVDSDAIFCTDLIEIIRLTDAYYLARNEHPKGFKWKAYRLHFAMIQQGNPSLYSSIISSQSSKTLIEQNLNQMFSFVNNGQVEQLRKMAKILPQKAALYRCDYPLPITKEKKKICFFWRAASQIREYILSLEPMKNGMIMKILNTRIDYVSFLKQTEMKEILTTVQNQNTALVELSKWVTLEVKKDTKKRFNGLKTYYQKLSSFNKEKASADIGYIKGRLATYKTEVNTLINDLSSRVGTVMKYACTAVSLEIAEQTIQLALASAVLMNPLEKLFGGSSAGDLMDRAAKLASTLTDIALLTRAAKSFAEIKTRTSDISTKLGKNAKCLGDLNALINIKEDSKESTSDFDAKRKSFLESYKDYNPEVKRPELVAMSTVYGNLVDALCEVIMNTETSAAAYIRALMKGQGLCPKAKEVAEKMFSTFAEIYDFQFELIETMASYMRASNAHHAASEIDADYDKLASENTDTLGELQSLTKFAYISYKLNIWAISESYCDVLMYKEGGKAPSVCKSFPKNIERLISHVSPVCRNTEAFKDVPITSANNPQAFMRLSDLYARKPVYFQVPSSQWLVDNRWISASDKDKTIVVKKFEVFLPTQSTVPRVVDVNAQPTLDNKLSTSSKVSYVITPEKEFVFQYYEGAGSEEACKQASQVLNNPYGGNLTKLCRLNVDENNCQELLQKTPLFPSVYSRWKITVSGYEAVKPPTPSNADFKLKVGVKLCILGSRGNDQEIQDGRGKKIRKQMRDRERESCPKPTDYWSVEKGRCIQCPKGSKPELDGYFCAKQQNPP